MPEHIVVFGLNHRTAPIELRERWAFSAEEAVAALQEARNSFGDLEGVILSTCHRTEIYSRLPGAGNGGGDSANGAHRPLLDFYQHAKRCPPGALDAHLYVRQRREAVQHLFRLASGLESMIIGEGQILRQIRDAFDLARRAGAVGRLFHRLFPAAIRTGRRVRSDTGLGAGGGITMGKAAVRIAEKALGSLAGRRLLIIGSGKIAGLTAAAFRESSLENFYVINRSPERARELVERICGLPRPWSDLLPLLADVDVAISSTGASEPIVRAADLYAAIAARGGRPLVVIDLAVPRDFDAEVGRIPGVRLINVDQIEQFIEESLGSRRAEIPQAESIVHEELTAFFSQMNWSHLDPVIRHLMERFETLRSEELAKILEHLPSEHRAAVDRFSVSLMKKFINFPIEKLKSLRDGDGLNPTEIAFLRRLFLTHEHRPAGDTDHPARDPS